MLNIAFPSTVHRRIACVGRSILLVLMAVGALAQTAAGAEFNLAAHDTLSAVELNRGDTIAFTLRNGDVRRIELISTSARVLFTTLKELKKSQAGAGTLYEMSADVRIDGHPFVLRRYVASQEAFYEPYVINGVRFWLDAVGDIATFLNFNHGDCQPRRDARLALQDASLRICPEELLPWYNNPSRFINIADSYNGDDCWLGPYFGADAHGGLDINQPLGSVNFTPLRLDDHFYFNSLAKGDNNNRWRGVRRWANGDVWMIQTHHLLSLIVPEHTPMAAGDPIGYAAGIRIGDHAHSHYNFKVLPAGSKEDIDLDPWILFWQIFEDAKQRAGEVHASMTPLRPARTGMAVNFESTGSRPGPGRPQLRYSWSFGDGGGSLEAAPSHTYAQPGVYAVTLTVHDGSNAATTTQHLTVNGSPVAGPTLSLAAPDETNWRPRPLDAQDVYGIVPSGRPRLLEFVARPGKPAPRARDIQLVNTGGGILPPGAVRIDQGGGAGWLKWELHGTGNQQLVRVRVDAAGLPGALYTARMTIEVPGALNASQSFEVNLLVPTYERKGSRAVIVDNAGVGFSATPWFWIGHRFHGVPAKGHADFYLLNGGRARQDGYARFTPDLRAGRHDVTFADTTPFSADAGFTVRIRHAHGEETRWIEPAKSRVIGTFDFADGIDGFVEITTAGSRGQVCADAVIFKPLVSPPGRQKERVP
ncbi:MAG: PKD domain-containing protein [Opitutaceae bacterium]|nr:PKD domain-containing protein [Opitutaceae bacterium]